MLALTNMIKFGLWRYTALQSSFDTMPAFCWNSSGQQMIDLNPHHLDLVRTTLRSHIPDSTVVAFGSRVKWTASGFSDLDLVVCDIKTLDFSTMGRLRDAFDESNLPIRVDVHDWNAIPDHFKPSIVDSYEVLVQGKRRFPPGETIESALESVRPTIESDADLRVLTIGSFAPFLYGKSLPARVRNEDGSVPVYGSNGIVGWHDQALTDGPTVIIGRKGTVGTVHYSDIPCWPIDTTFYVHGTDHSLIRYKYLLLSSLSLDKMNADSAVPGLNRNEAHATVVNVPDEAEQRRVARALGSLDDRIELNRRMAATLEGMAQALFKSWFVDFDPVRAKMEGRHTGLPDHIADLFPDGLVDSPLGSIPKGWRSGTLGEIASDVRRTIQPKAIESQSAYIALGHIPRGSIALYEWATADDVESGKRVFNSGEILFGRLRPYFHKVGVAPVDGVCSTDIIVVSPISPSWFGPVLGHMSSSQVVDYASAATTGTRMPRTNWATISAYELAVPSLEVADSYTRILRQFVDKIVSSTHYSRCLSQARELILSHLMSGSSQEIPSRIESYTQ